MDEMQKKPATSSAVITASDKRPGLEPQKILISPDRLQLWGPIMRFKLKGRGEWTSWICDMNQNLGISYSSLTYEVIKWN